MDCQLCGSERTQLSAEINIHFPAMSGLTKPPVWVFPVLQVCLECGLTEFIIPPQELRALGDGRRDVDAKAS